MVDKLNDSYLLYFDTEERKKEREREGKYYVRGALHKQTGKLHDLRKELVQNGVFITRSRCDYAYPPRLHHAKQAYALYARSGIYAVYLEETINELILRLIGIFRKTARQLLILLSRFFFKSARFLANDSSRQLIIDAYFQTDNQALSRDLFVHATLRES